jgi:hypothetical protein
VRENSHELVVLAIFRAELLATQPQRPQTKMIRELMGFVLERFRLNDPPNSSGLWSYGAD